MKLEHVLNYLNSFEKNPFLKCIDNIISEKPKNFKEVDKILNQLDGRLKNADSASVGLVLGLVEDEFSQLVREEFLNTTTQLDILIDIINRDGNSLMKREWLGQLYDKEIKKIKSKLKDFKALLEEEATDGRLRDYRIYSECLKTAYHNDRENNQENKITNDEQSILVTLARQLELSHEEIKLINYSILPLEKLDVDEIIKYLTGIGVIFYSRKNHQIYVADEVVRVLRKIRGKEIPDKIFRIVLKQLKDSQINQLSRKHNINWKLSREEKIKEIIDEGISFRGAISNGIFKDDVSKTDRKNFVNELVEKRLSIEERIKGSTMEAKLGSLIEYFERKERDGAISISISGYDKLMQDLARTNKTLKKKIKTAFELQEEDVLGAKFLLNYNIKPMDILYLMEDEEIKQFCEAQSISTRGSEVQNILAQYKDVENLFIENYVNIAMRNYNLLVENGLDIKEADLGIKFEEVTKTIFRKLGFTIADDLRKTINTAKDKMDILLKDKDESVIVIECKSIKERGYNKYSAVSRQMKAYKALAEKNSLIVKKLFLIAPEFTDDFVNECGLDYELNLSLITADTLLDIYQVCQESGNKTVPISLLMRDVLIDKERVLKALGR
ncbi:MAG: hypothetical protein ACRBG0_00085 [Lewinella sp.]|jgi:hypothetical protein|uniref:hypothetical protein n=1 Tax=Lewinella sp. TaxID=2004506 RepID=UPI003D6A7175